MSNFWSVVLFVWIFGAWLTHVIICIATSKWLLLLVGAIFFPIGCVHGTGIWLGMF